MKKPLELHYDGGIITFSDFDEDEDIKINIHDFDEEDIPQYLCKEQVVILFEYLKDILGEDINLFK